MNDQTSEIYVGHLNCFITDEDLKQFFIQKGFKPWHIRRPDSTYAFVYLESKRDEALNLNGSKLKDNYIKVSGDVPKLRYSPE
jgi:hypothetical protein